MEPSARQTLPSGEYQRSPFSGGCLFEKPIFLPAKPPLFTKAFSRLRSAADTSPFSSRRKSSVLLRAFSSERSENLKDFSFMREL